VGSTAILLTQARRTSVAAEMRTLIPFLAAAASLPHATVVQ